MLYLNAALNTILYLSVSGILTVAFLRFYVWFTPYDEFKMIREGNVAAATSLAGTLIGFVLPLASVILHTHKILDLVVWSIIGMVVQSIVFLAVDFMLSRMNTMMAANNVAAGVFLGAASVAAGVLTAACLIP